MCIYHILQYANNKIYLIETLSQIENKLNLVILACFRILT